MGDGQNTPLIECAILHKLYFSTTFDGSSALYFRVKFEICSNWQSKTSKASYLILTLLQIVRFSFAGQSYSRFFTKKTTKGYVRDSRQESGIEPVRSGCTHVEGETRHP